VEGNVNFTVLSDVLEWQLAHGIADFHLLGSTGEGLGMSETERRTAPRCNAARGFSLHACPRPRRPAITRPAQVSSPSIRFP